MRYCIDELQYLPNLKLDETQYALERVLLQIELLLQCFQQFASKTSLNNYSNNELETNRHYVTTKNRAK